MLSWIPTTETLETQSTWVPHTDCVEQDSGFQSTLAEVSGRSQKESQTLV